MNQGTHVGAKIIPHAQKAVNRGFHLCCIFANLKKHLFFAGLACIIDPMMKTKTLPKSRGFATIVNGKLTVYVGATQREMALKFFNTKVVKVKFDYLGLGRVANVEIV